MYRHDSCPHCAQIVERTVRIYPATCDYQQRQMKMIFQKLTEFLKTLTERTGRARCNNTIIEILGAMDDISSQFMPENVIHSLLELCSKISCIEQDKNRLILSRQRLNILIQSQRRLICKLRRKIRTQA